MQRKDRPSSLSLPPWELEERMRQLREDAAAAASAIATRRRGSSKAMATASTSSGSLSFQSSRSIQSDTAVVDRPRALLSDTYEQPAASAERSQRVLSQDAVAVAQREPSAPRHQAIEPMRAKPNPFLIPSDVDRPRPTAPRLDRPQGGPPRHADRARTAGARDSSAAAKARAELAALFGEGPGPQDDHDEPTPARPQVSVSSKPSRTFVLPAASGPGSAKDAAAQESAQAYQPFSKLLPAGVKELAEPVLDLAGLQARLASMDTEQVLAWLLLTPTAQLKPMSPQQVREMTAARLQTLDEQTFHQLRPASYWITDPAAQLKLYSDGKVRRAAVQEEPSVLPGGVGAWLSAQRLSSTESNRRSPNSQRINAISLAGLVMASNQFEAMNWMLAERLDPLRPAALFGCSKENENRGHDIGQVNGYALALLAHAAPFFRWCSQWKPVLEDRARGRERELTGALALAVKVWSQVHGELNAQCSEMAVVMLQVGADLNSARLKAFSPNGPRHGDARAALARLCAQTFSADRRGEAVRRILMGAKVEGVDLIAKPGEPNPMAPFVQADLADAVRVFVRMGFPVDVPDVVGQTMVQRAHAARAQSVLALLEGDLTPALAQAQVQAQAPLAASPSQEDRQRAEAERMAREQALLVLKQERDGLQQRLVDLQTTAQRVRALGERLYPKLAQAA